MDVHSMCGSGYEFRDLPVIACLKTSFSCKSRDKDVAILILTTELRKLKCAKDLDHGAKGLCSIDLHCCVPINPAM